MRLCVNSEKQGQITIIFSDNCNVFYRMVSLKVRVRDITYTLHTCYSASKIFALEIFASIDKSFNDSEEYIYNSKSL